MKLLTITAFLIAGYFIYKAFNFIKKDREC
jgi:hypothetical protein